MNLNPAHARAAEKPSCCRCRSRRCQARQTLKAALVMLLTLSCTQLAHLAKATLLANSSSTNSSGNAKAVADQLLAAFSGSQADLSELKQQASYVLDALGGPPPAAAASTQPQPQPAAAATAALATAPVSPGPVASSPAQSASAVASASTLEAVLAQLAQSQPAAAAVAAPVSPSPVTSSPAQSTSAAGPTLAAILEKLTTLPQASPTSPTPAPSTQPMSPAAAAAKSSPAPLSNAFSSLYTPGLASSLLQGTLFGTSSSHVAASPTPNVTAAGGPSLANAFAPIGSGDNILEFRKRVQAVKEWYKEARTYLHIDDAVRIGGYINTLESLGISFLAAYPVAEISYFVANVALGAAITSLLGGILYTAAGAVGLLGSIIGLQAALDSAAAANQANAAAAAAAADASGRSFNSTENRDYTSASASPPTSTITVDTSASSTLSSFLSNTQMVNTLVGSSEDLTNQLLPWVMGGGVLAPLSLATDVMGAASQSLDRLNSWTPPDSLVSGLSNFASSVSAGRR